MDISSIRSKERKRKERRKDKFEIIRKRIGRKMKEFMK